MIKRIIEKVKQLIEDENRRRFLEVRYEWIKFYETRQQHLGTVELPAFVLADQQMEAIKANNEVNYYYKKIMKYRKQKGGN